MTTPLSMRLHLYGRTPAFQLSRSVLHYNCIKTVFMPPSLCSCAPVFLCSEPVFFCSLALLHTSSSAHQLFCSLRCHLHTCTPVLLPDDSSAHLLSCSCEQRQPTASVAPCQRGQCSTCPPVSILTTYCSYSSILLIKLMPGFPTTA